MPTKDGFWFLRRHCRKKYFTTSYSANSSPHIASSMAVMAASGRRFISRLQLSNTALFICDVQEKFRPLIYKSESLINRCVLMNQACGVLGVPVIATEQYPKAFGPTVPDIVLPIPSFAKTQFSMMTSEVDDAFGTLGKTQVRGEKRVDNFMFLFKRIYCSLVLGVCCVCFIQVLMCGVEAHVCVLQTVLDLLASGIEVHIVCDAVSSQRYERCFALVNLVFTLPQVVRVLILAILSSLVISPLLVPYLPLDCPYRSHDRAVALRRMRDAGAVLTTAESALFDLLRDSQHPNFKAVSGLLRTHNAVSNEFAGDDVY